MEKVNYQGWPNCYRLANGVVEVIATTDVGPRIIRFGLPGEDNQFKEFADMVGKTGGDEWRIYGGHRLWHAPEVAPRTYFPDNGPIQVEQRGEGLRLVQPTEPTTGIQKEIELHLVADQAQAVVTHRLRNRNLWAVELAPWAISVMAPGGRAVVPLPPRGSHETHLLPTSTLSLWAYTDMTDPRWGWGSRYLLLCQDPVREMPQKAGLMVPDGWAAYARDNHLFVKTFTYQQGGRYPDFGCSVEIFTNADFLEVETLGPLVVLQPGATVEHVEHWFLFADVPMPETDADVERDLLPKIETAKEK